jgi:hypothetical protein
MTLGEIFATERQAMEFFEKNPVPLVSSTRRDGVLLTRDNIDYRDTISSLYTMVRTILDNGAFFGGRTVIGGQSAGVMESARARARVAAIAEESAVEIGLAGEREFVGNAIIDMTGAPAGSAKNALGYPVNKRYFWTQMAEQYPEYFSPENKALIDRGLAPVVDEQWLKYHPGQELYQGDILVHHHIDQGPYAVGIPNSFHRLFHKLLHPLTDCTP